MTRYTHAHAATLRHPLHPKLCHVMDMSRRITRWSNKFQKRVFSLSRLVSYLTLCTQIYPNPPPLPPTTPTRPRQALNRGQCPKPELARSSAARLPYSSSSFPLWSSSTWLDVGGGIKRDHSTIPNDPWAVQKTNGPLRRTS